MENSLKPAYFGYLRVSTDVQDVESQKLGLLEYANRMGFAPVKMVSETVSRTVPWVERELGKLLQMTKPGDVILTPEFTRLASKPGQVFTFLEEAAGKGVVIHITKTGTVMDGSMQSQIWASVFSMASLIEVSFIRERTKEGLQRARQEGKTLGRPLGSKGISKLAGREEEIKGLLVLGLSKRKIAVKLEIAYNTLARFVKDSNLGETK